MIEFVRPVEPLSTDSRFAKGLGLVDRTLVGVGRVGEGDGDDRLLARPKINLAADATLQTPPPPVSEPSLSFVVSVLPRLK